MRIIVVDNSDNFLAVKDDDVITHEDIYRVAALWLTNSKGQVLVAQ